MHKMYGAKQSAYGENGLLLAGPLSLSLACHVGNNIPETTSTCSILWPPLLHSPELNEASPGGGRVVARQREPKRGISLSRPSARPWCGWRLGRTERGGVACGGRWQTKTSLAQSRMIEWEIDGAALDIVLRRDAAAWLLEVTWKFHC